MAQRGVPFLSQIGAVSRMTYTDYRRQIANEKPTGNVIEEGGGRALAISAGARRGRQDRRSVTRRLNCRGLCRNFG